MDNNIKIYKSNGIATKVEINGQRITGIKSVKIKNDYTSKMSEESVVIELTDVLLEVKNENA